MYFSLGRKIGCKLLAVFPTSTQKKLLKMHVFNAWQKVIGVNDFRFLQFSCVQNGRYVTVTVPETSFGNPGADIDRNYPTTRRLTEIHVPHFTFVLPKRAEHEELIKGNIKKRPNIVSFFQLCFNSYILKAYLNSIPLDTVIHLWLSWLILIKVGTAIRTLNLEFLCTFHFNLVAKPNSFNNMIYLNWLSLWSFDRF
jgi:hypothetical protein